MVLNHCTVCAVYESEREMQRRIPVRCLGERVMLLLGSEREMSDASGVRIDFFDSQIGCIQTRCELIVRKNHDHRIPAPWVADCEISEVLEITQGQRRSLRAKMEKVIPMHSFAKGMFEGTTQNISEGGVYFITRTRLSCEDTVAFSYQFVDKEYRLKAVILREEDLRDGRYGYGCQFLDIPKEARRSIQQYVYLRQQGQIW